VDPEFEVAKVEKLQSIHKNPRIDRAIRLRKIVIKPLQVFLVSVWHQLVPSPLRRQDGVGTSDLRLAL
jgi:hypothetical protein